MGLMQRAYETYEALAPKYAGIYDETQKEPLAPVSHLTKKMDWEICIDTDGRFHSANKLGKKEQIAIIPATESAFNRTSTAIAPYPLCEKLEYLYDKDSAKYKKYVEQLEAWSSYDPDNVFLLSVLKYIKNGTIIHDLCDAGLIKLDKGEPDKKDKKIVWRVLGCAPDECSRNHDLIDSFIRFYANADYYIRDDEKKNKGKDNTILPLSKRKTDFCMISGAIQPVALAHRKSIVSDYGNAKLISSNDSDGYTFRGRFIVADEALIVGYDASQKAYNALSWLIANQGVKAEDHCKKVFLCWTPQGIKLPSVVNPFLPPAKPIVSQSDYKDKLQKTLKGWKANITDNAQAIIAAFDATSDKAGRLSVVYYNELQASDFLDRLYAWDESCCWFNDSSGIQSPSLYQIIRYAFGKRKKENIECDDSIVKQHIQRLVACRIEKAMMPVDIERALVYRCGNLQLYEEELRKKILFTACAVIRKYHAEKAKEEWSLALEPNKKNRSYQFGRLLAIMEKAERDTYNRDENREPNAIRLQPMFVRQPLKTTETVIEQLKKAYYPRLNLGRRIFYDRLIAEIMNEISETNESWDSPLEDTYIMGYYLQKRELHQAKDKEDKQ